MRRSYSDKFSYATDNKLINVISDLILMESIYHPGVGVHSKSITSPTSRGRDLIMENWITDLIDKAKEVPKMLSKNFKAAEKLYKEVSRLVEEAYEAKPFSASFIDSVLKAKEFGNIPKDLSISSLQAFIKSNAGNVDRSITEYTVRSTKGIPGFGYKPGESFSTKVIDIVNKILGINVLSTGVPLTLAIMHFSDTMGLNGSRFSFLAIWTATMVICLALGNTLQKILQYRGYGNGYESIGDRGKYEPESDRRINKKR